MQNCLYSNNLNFKIDCTVSTLQHFILRYIKMFFLSQILFFHLIDINLDKCIYRDIMYFWRMHELFQYDVKKTKQD